MANEYKLIDHAYDVVIVGAGGAGLRATLGMAAAGLSTACITKVFPTRSHTVAAQGGIAAVLDKNDSFESHIQDTLNAGAGLCSTDVVRHVVEHGPAAIQWLINQNVPFSFVDEGHPESGNWGIENKLHWVKDVTFGEDSSKIKNGNAPENMSIMRMPGKSIIKA